MRRFLVEASEAAEAGHGLKMTTFSREQNGLKLPADLADEILSGLPSPSPAPIIPGAPSSPHSPRETALSLALRDLDPGLWGIVDKSISNIEVCNAWAEDLQGAVHCNQ